MSKVFFKKIIAAVNGRLSSVNTAMYAIMMAKTYRLELKFVYVIDTATIKYLAMNKFLVADEKYDYEEKLTADGENTLKYVNSLAQLKGVSAETELRKGGVCTEIIKCADEYEADLILLGGMEKDVLKRNVISQDQNEILANASCPVILVQKPDIEKLFKIF